MHIAAWYHGPPPPDQRSRNSGNMCRLARPLTLPNFVALRQKNVRDVLCRKCCFPEKFTLGHQICHQSIGRTRVFSERELTFAFAICYRPSVCLSSVVCLSICNARAPYSGGWNFRQYFYGIWYIGHPLISTEKFTEIVTGEPLRRGSYTRGVAKYSDFAHISKAISRKRCKIGSKLVLITNRKSHMSFRYWYQNRWPWMTLNGILAVILRISPNSCTMSS